MTIRDSLSFLAAEAGVPLAGLDDDALDIIGIRLTAECIDVHGHTPFVCLGRIVDSVRSSLRAGGGDNELDGEGEPVALPSVPRPRFLATERTTRQRLAAKHDAEDRRTALYLVPRKPDPIPAFAVHPPCKAAFQDGGQPCSRCAPILHPADCECESCDYFIGVQE